MIKLMCIFFGVYLILDSLYLGSHANNENRHCMIAKYVGALMCGVYLVLLNVKDLAVEWGVIKINNYLFISNDAAQIELLFAVTIAFFMWPDTFYRGIEWLQRKNPKLYYIFILYFPVKSRRRTE